MNKLKLLFASLALLVGSGTAWGQTVWTDKTSVIVNPSFETDATVSDATTSDFGTATATVTGWTIMPSGSPGNSQAAVVDKNSTLSVLNGSDGATEGSKYFYVRENWNNDPQFGITQTIAATDVPEGYYLLTCKIKTSSSSPDKTKWYISLKEGDGEEVRNDNAGSAAEWLNYGIMLYKKSNSTSLTISAYFVAGASGGSQHYAMLIDDVQLKYVSPADFNGISSSKALDMTGAIYNEGIYNANKTNKPRGWIEYGRSGGNGNYTENTGNTQLEGWAADGADFSRDYYQTINNLPNGKYTVSAKCHDTNERGAYLYIYSDDQRKTVNMPKDYGVITTPELDVNGSANIGIKIDNSKGTWMTGDDFQLTFTNPERISTIAVDMPEGGSMEAEKWYKYTIPADGDYTFSVTDGSVKYSVEDLAILPSVTVANTASDATVAFAGGAIVYLYSAKAQTLELNRVTPIVENGTFYLYDDVNKVFVSRGANYGTRATVDKSGIPLIWSNYSKCISYKDWSDTYLFFDNTPVASWLYSDGGADREHRYFVFVKANEEGGLYLQDINKTAYVRNDGNVLLPTANQAEATIWTLKNREQHDAILSGYPADNKQAIITAAGITTTPADFESYLAANLAAKDKTSSISKAKFTDSDKGNWAWTDVRSDGNVNYGNGYAEAFRKSGNWAQEVTGLQKGIYKVTVNAFERANGYAVMNTIGAEGWEPETAYMDVNGQKVQLKSWYSEKEGTNNPNNTGEAATAFNNDKYKNTVYAYVGDDGKLTITIAKPSFTWDSWVLFNNVTLTYYDSNVSDEEAVAILEEATTEMNKPMKHSLYAPLSSAKTAFDGARTVPNYNALRAAIDNTPTSIASYANMYANYLQPITTALATTNFVDNTSAGYVEYKAYLDAYNNYKEDGCADVENATANELDWKAGGRYVTPITKVMMANWTIGGTAALTNESGLYINSWSTESAGTGDAKDFANPFIEYWVSSGSLAATTLTGTLTGLTPNKAYSVSANVRVQGTDKVAKGITMEVVGGIAVDVTDGNQIGETNRYIKNYTAVGVTDADGKLELNFNVAASSNISWLAIRDINYAESDAEIQVGYTEVNSTIASINGNLGFQKDEYAPYNNVAKMEALATANSFVEGRYYTKDLVDAAKTELQDGWVANAAEVNAIYWPVYTAESPKDGSNRIYAIGWNLNGRTDAYDVRIQNNVSTDAGLAAVENNTALFTKYNTTYGETTGYTLPLKANKTYKITFKYCGWGNQPTTNIVLTDPDGNPISLAPGFRPATSDGNSNAEHWYDYTGYFVTTSAGNYLLSMNKVQSGQQQIACGEMCLVSAPALEFTDGAVPTYAPGTYPIVKVSRTMTKDRWVTAVYPFELSIPAALSGKVSVATLDSYNKETGALGFTSASANTANVPFLMRSTNETAIAMINANGLTATNVAVAAATVSDATAAEASLKGTYAVKKITNDEKNYVLSNNVIYPVGTAGATINPYRAYIQIDQDAPEARLSFFVDNEEVTGIEGLQMEKVAKGAVYNLNGQRVEKAKKGLYIQGGKKLYVK